ncbi:MAG TPA: hypothetical protein VIQ74_15045, partial [Gemmatimonadaceae bacterium]
MNEALLVSPIRSLCTHGTSRITASVDGLDAWFESDDMELRPAPEAFASAFLIPAAAQARRLVLSDPVAPDFATGPQRVLEIVERWWHYSQLPPSLDTRTAVPSQRSPATVSNGRAALCFSGGVDSFYTLLASGRHVDTLVFANGFDIKLADPERAAVFDRHLREIAAAVGARPVVIRTNLRAHPAFRAAPWEHTHGGALAAIGHLLADQANTLLVSSSVPLVRPRPWGSHWELDPLWSGAGLTIEHLGAERDRGEKLAALKDEPLVRQYLRVCWENRSARLNCSRCEKCLRTQIVLAAVGVLDSFPVFEPTATLADRLDELPLIHDHLLFRYYNNALALGLPSDIAGAVHRLLGRSHRALRRQQIEDARETFRALAGRVWRR